MPAIPPLPWQIPDRNPAPRKTDGPQGEDDGSMDPAFLTGAGLMAGTSDTIKAGNAARGLHKNKTGSARGTSMGK